jgi:RNA polymerase sigma-70 factor (ECF subfamily)
MLGSSAEAEDAVQEAWLKLDRAETGAVKNLGGWLTTVVARICLDMLRSRRARREEPLLPTADEPSDNNPEVEVGLADAIGPALMVVLDELSPAERVAFVLHDMFDLSFEEIAPILDRTPEAARQLASRARRSLRGAAAPVSDVVRQRQLVDSFLAASRDGDFERLLAVLSGDVVLRADDLAVRTAAANRSRGAPALTAEVRGASRVADVFKGRARAALPALIDGEAGAVWRMADRILSAFMFTIEGDKISSIELIMDPNRLGKLDVRLD